MKDKGRIMAIAKFTSNLWSVSNWTAELSITLENTQEKKSSWIYWVFLTGLREEIEAVLDPTEQNPDVRGSTVSN